MTGSVRKAGWRPGSKLRTLFAAITSVGAVETMRHLGRFLVGGAGLLLPNACQQSPKTAADATNEMASQRRLPTGALLDPVAASSQLGSMPLAMTLSPDRSQLVVLLNGWREQGIRIIDRSTGRIVQTLEQPVALKGQNVPYPGTNRMSALEWKRSY